MNWKNLLKSKNLLRILLALNLINAFYSTFIFLVFLRVPVQYWAFLNICAPIQFFTVITLLIKEKVLANVAVPLLVYFGFGGLFVFSWSGYMIQAQLNHVLMTATAIYILLTSLRDRRKMITGISIGILIVLIVVLFVSPIMMNIPEVKEILEQMA